MWITTYYKRDWLILVLEGRSNPILVNKSQVVCIAPMEGNELKSIVTLLDNDHLVINQPTGSIEEQL
ncbi:MAG: hypothetical protein US20_C0026G0020 [Candidatus Pacebacteria bacterium GW2011_GWF1_36_5]|nr:MAG: hypothetical protein US20_C0026G0020 [Candidatus Pacebacteria bacterium GW2011_GWF1_36_5]